ncbi:SDR family NAD(P)-dependent oxidoreductase [Verminephrobacter aporrectodeae]|uniref:SDR family oxidoreductase n=1 Tax=Verminephrobacter aporrectodeae subsp. tuberculatae TaxID=1110392 RepID=A0ABT3KTK3_9BURK|nr:SDR family NAD(P)-dependent oxidoreductase [Verminephrobacter aporrectodeae]MCW5222642.1 SDR family oxidoreductase [Verminephrobacter aporrectodeae subsp. tuberculatae]MCW5257126.1 SDR family oxidoreductase [Verminephrobacter aporrectodeae subsp. tuberculatae]MCW5288106.1 SDR family oxidoreductase [Verminephrobacter aporrectodeae subsp. tuberculatae]MCW5321672.1 SDR family oxidoreductase [Verminephrobacter aporrectodeae subsp. tuberculatae]MCW8164268.1 SDR family oxidoreductase [Verminephro
MDQEARTFDRSLQGRVALVTGAGSRADGVGNGRATALLLARDGARVLLLDSVAEWAQATQEMIAREGGQAQLQVCDVSRDADCREAVEQAVRTWGRIDILVNNVGIAGPAGTAVDLDLQDWDMALRVNVTSMMLMARHCIPHMAAQRRGAIVNIASVAGLIGGHPSLLYPTSKGAVVNMTRAMAAHHGAQGIRVNCVAPGMVHTPMVYARGMSDAIRETRRKRSFLQTEGSGWDVGHAVRYLASDESGWVTGAVLPVDAGATAGRHSY